MALEFSLDHVGLSVQAEHVDATVNWYVTNLDFTVERSFEVNGTNFTFITHGDLRIELVGAASAPSASPASDVASSHTSERLHHVCIAVADLEATLAELADRGIAPITGPMNVPSIGQSFAFITDNCGNIIELTEPGGPRA